MKTPPIPPNCKYFVDGAFKFYVEDVDDSRVGHIINLDDPGWHRPMIAAVAIVAWEDEQSVSCPVAIENAELWREWRDAK